MLPLRSLSLAVLLGLCTLGVAAPQEKKDNGSTIQVPDGTPEEMLQYLRSRRIQAPADIEALVKGTEKVVSHPKATDAQKTAARSFAVQILYRGIMQFENKFEKEFDDYVAKVLKEHPNTEEAGTAAAFRWARKYIKAGEVNEAGVAELWELHKAYPKHDLVPQLFTVAGRLIKDDQKAVTFMKKSIETFGADSPMGKQFETLLFHRELTGKELEIVGPSLKGESFNIASLKGKVVLVDFWATWCGPCVMEMPNVKAVYEKYKDKGFDVVAISLDQSRENLEKFVKDRQVPWTQIIFSGEKDMGWNTPLARKYKINSIPATFLLGRDGKVIARDLRGPALEKAVAEQIEKSQPGK